MVFNACSMQKLGGTVDCRTQSCPPSRTERQEIVLTRHDLLVLFRLSRLTGRLMESLLTARLMKMQF